jgi:hypothetical protein
VTGDAETPAVWLIVRLDRKLDVTGSQLSQDFLGNPLEISLVHASSILRQAQRLVNDPGDPAHGSRLIARLYTQFTRERNRYQRTRSGRGVGKSGAGGIAGSGGMVTGASRSALMSFRLPTTRQLNVPVRSISFFPIVVA